MIRYIDRSVSDLAIGDRFTFTDETDMHTCAGPYSEVSGSGTVAVDDPVVIVDVDGPDQTVLVEVDITRINVTLRLEIDTVAWAREFGTDPTFAAVFADARAYFDPINLIPEHLRGIVGVKGTDTALDPVGKPE
jgi:hypothetical protein